MNPLELQVLSIVCGVGSANQGAPAPDALIAREPAVILPAKAAPARPQRLPAAR